MIKPVTWENAERFAKEHRPFWRDERIAKTLSVELSDEEANFLLYLESRAVEYGGVVDKRYMNDDDLKTSYKWNDEGFIEFGWLAETRPRSHYYVILSPTAWSMAHKLRRARFERMYSKREWQKEGE